MIIAAIGNRSESKGDFPANLPGVISVGATDRSDSRAEFSSFGRDLDIVAPGTDIYAVWATGQKLFGSGTSLATPQVSAAASLILSLRPELGPRTVEALLYAGADDVGEPGWDEQTGWGRLNVRNSLMLARCKTRIEEREHERLIAWEAPPNAPGRVRYRLHTSEDLADWQEVPSPDIRFHGLEASATVPRATETRFYRVSVEVILDLTPRVLRRDGVDAPIPFGVMLAESVDPLEPDPADLERYQTAILEAQQAEDEFVPGYYRCKFNPKKFPFLAGYTRFGPKHLFERWGHRPFQVAQEMLTYGPESVDEAFPASGERSEMGAATDSDPDDPWINPIPAPIDPGEGDPSELPKLGDLISVDEASETFIAHLPQDIRERLEASDWIDSVTPLPTPQRQAP